MIHTLTRWLSDPSTTKARKKPRKARKPPTSHRARLEVQQLENRLVPSTLYWDAGGDGDNWHDGDNWEPNQVPSSGDDVNLPNGFQIINAYASNPVHIRDLDWSGDLSQMTFEDDFTARDMRIAADQSWIEFLGDETMMESLTLQARDDGVYDNSVNFGGAQATTGALTWTYGDLGGTLLVTDSLTLDEDPEISGGKVLSGVLQNGGTANWYDDDLDLGGGRIENLEGATFNVGHGAGALDAQYLAWFTTGFKNEGTLNIDPEYTRALSIGTGTFQQTNTGVLNLDVLEETGNAYDRINAGSLNLGGSLKVTLLDEEEIEAGDVFHILTGTRTGTFSEVDLPELDNGLFLEVVYHSSGVDLIVTIAVDVAYDVAKNQTIHAEAGVGLLADPYDQRSNSLTVTSITVNGNTYSPGATPRTTAAGGQITVWSTGSFVYVPYTNYTGTDTFTFTISDGVTTGTGMAYMEVKVPTDPEEEEEEEIDFTDDGTLQYDRSEADFDEEFTVEEVPFVLEANPIGNLILVFPAFAVRLPEVSSAALVNVPSIGNVTIRSDLNNFTFFRGQELVAHIVHVRLDVDAAIDHLTTYMANQNPLDTLEWEVARWFVDSEFVDSESNVPEVLNTVISVFQHVADGLDENTTVYYDHPTDADDFGYVEEDPVWGWYVGIGLLYHSGSAKAQYATVIHELTHLYANTEDFGYWRVAELENSSVIWRDPDDPNTVLTIEDIYTQLLLNNADSYAGYLAQHYYG